MMHHVDAASLTALPQQQQQQPRAALRAVDDGDEHAVPTDASVSSRTARADGSTAGVADLAANAELSGTVNAVPSSATEGATGIEPPMTVATDEFADFQPFAPAVALPQLSPCLNVGTWSDHDNAIDGLRRRRRYHSNTDSFTLSNSSSSSGGTLATTKAAILKPSPEAIATAFTPLRQGKIERTKELMERVALVKAQFRARQLAANGPVRR